MNGVYKSLKGKVQDTLQLGKVNAPPVPSPEKSAAVLSLNDEMEKLEKVVAERLARLKTAVNDSEATMSGETRQAQQATANLKERITALEAKLKETEETVRKKDSSRQQIEETLKAKVHELQNDLKRKEEALAARGKEIQDLKAGFDGKAKQISELTLASEKAQQEAAGHAKRAEDLGTASTAKIAELQSQLSEKEELARQKDLTIKEVEQKLADKIQALDSLTKNKQELLAGRDAVISDLKSQLKLLTKGIGEMSSFFRQAQAFAVVERQDFSSAFRNSPVAGKAERPITQSGAVTAGPNLQEGKPVTMQPNGAGVTPTVEDEKRAVQSTGMKVMPPIDDEKPVATSSNNAKPGHRLPEERPSVLRSNAATITQEEKSAADGSNGATVKPVGPEAAVQTVSPALFERMSAELAEVSGVMSPLAMLIVREHVTALGESTENFPESRLAELMNSLAREILDANLQIDFRKRLAQNARRT